jgi:hypothetical protein
MFHHVNGQQLVIEFGHRGRDRNPDQEESDEET